MGTDGHLVAVGPRGEHHLHRAEARLAELEQLWSRFIDSSEVSMLNAAAGQVVRVSPETRRLVEVAVAAWRLTNGLFDPTLGRHMEAMGYDRDFSAIEGVVPAGPRPISSACASISIGADGDVTMASDISFDPGGIGKGLAADIVTAEMQAAGAWGAMVNVGGDLRTRGLGPVRDEWEVSIAEPNVAESALTQVTLRDGAVATSTTRKRRWAGPTGECHHVLDPSSGTSTDEDVWLASVIAGEGWWAEAAATAQLVASERAPECVALRVRANGRCERVGGFERYER
ncbi:MAG: FAD:protein FMN transferase [Acidimicrobiales bacterium]